MRNLKKTSVTLNPEMTLKARILNSTPNQKLNAENLIQIRN